MKLLTTVVALIALTGCESVLNTARLAAGQKANLNDIQAEVWSAQSCDLSLAGVRRKVPPTLYNALVLHCLDLDLTFETCPQEPIDDDNKLRRSVRDIYDYM